MLGDFGASSPLPRARLLLLKERRLRKAAGTSCPPGTKSSFLPGGRNKRSSYGCIVFYTKLLVFFKQFFLFKKIQNFKAK